MVGQRLKLCCSGGKVEPVGTGLMAFLHEPDGEDGKHCLSSFDAV